MRLSTRLKNFATPAYVYAKNSGMYARSFAGPRAAELFTAKTLTELWSIIFETDAPLLPEVILAKQIEHEAEKKFIDTYCDLLDAFSRPDDILVELLRVYDIENLQALGAASCTGSEKMPHLADIGEYSLIHADKWPSMADITAGSPFAWYNEPPKLHEQSILDTKLDNEYIKRVWKAVNKIHDESKSAVVDLIRDEFVMQNIIWAMRLRVYFDMSADEAVEYLACVTDSKNKKDVVFWPAFQILQKQTNVFADWADWKYVRYLNPREASGIWKLDPKWTENAFKAEQKIRLRKLFHRFPQTVAVLVAWFKMGRYELDVIRTACESICVGIDSKEAMRIAQIESA